MKKIVITYGLIAGFISTSLYLGLMLLGKAGTMDFKNGLFYGYTLMIIAFAFIFVATKIIRDKHNQGAISFGKAFMVGLYITLIASTVYVMVWLIDYYFFIPDFMDQYSTYTLSTMKAEGATQQEIQKTIEKMDDFKRMYKNPVFIALLTYAEILPVGLIITLINALILKRKPMNPKAAAIR